MIRAPIFRGVWLPMSSCVCVCARARMCVFVCVCVQERKQERERERERMTGCVYIIHPSSPRAVIHTSIIRGVMPPLISCVCVCVCVCVCDFS